MICTREWLRDAVLGVVLVAAVVPWVLGATYSPSGEQVSAGLPVATLVLGIGLLLRLRLSPSFYLPYMPRAVMLFVVAICFGFLGTGVAQLRTTAKELIQLAEIALLAVWMTQIGTRRRIRAACRNAFGTMEIALLLLATAGGLGHLGLSPAKWGGFVVLAAPFAVVLLGRCCPWLGVGLGLLAGLAFPHAGPLLLWCLVIVVSCLAFGRRHWPILLAVPIALAIAQIPSRANIWDRLHPLYDATHLRRTMVEAYEAKQAPYYIPVGSGPGQYKNAINQLRAYGVPEPHPEDTKVPRDGNSQYLVFLVESGVIGLLGFVTLLLLALAFACRRDERELSVETLDRKAVAVAVVGLIGASVFTLTLSSGIGIWVGVLIGLSSGTGNHISARQRMLRIGACGTVVFVLLLVSVGVNGGGHRWPSQINRSLASLFTGAPPIHIGPRVVVLPDEFAGQGEDIAMVEAETATDVMAPFRVVRSAGASGDQALAIPEGRGKGIGRATLRIKVQEAGRYLLFARVQWADGCGNSIALNHGDQEIRLSDELYHEWHQVEGRVPIMLPAGMATFQVVNLEDGVMLDYVGLRPEQE